MATPTSSNSLPWLIGAGLSVVLAVLGYLFFVAPGDDAETVTAAAPSASVEPSEAPDHTRPKICDSPIANDRHPRRRSVHRYWFWSRTVSGGPHPLPEPQANGSLRKCGLDESSR